MDALEVLAVVGPHVGSKPRDVPLTFGELPNIFGKQSIFRKVEYSPVMVDFAKPRVLAQGPGTISYERFLETVAEDVRAEWVQGKVFRMSPPSGRHQDVSRFLSAILSHYAEASDLGVVRPAPFQMKTGEALPGREPDILFVAKTNLERLKKNCLAGPADLCRNHQSEISSP